ncbi:MAG: SCO family protein [Bryobacteraceae bacterium]
MRLLRKSSLLAAALLAFGASLCADTPAERTPRELEQVGVTEHLNEKVDLNLTFIAEDGYPHALKEYFHAGRPVILNLVYYTCKMLCSVVLNAQVQSLRQLDWTPGNQYEIVTVSIDPAENFQLARDKKAAYLESFARPAPGWHFLTDNADHARQLASQVGFGYKFDAQTGQFAHPAVVFILSPEGRVCRYLYGVQFKPLDIRLGLTEAARERFGVTDRILLYCYHYDPVARGYVPFAENLMRAGGVLTVLIMALVLYSLWRRERITAAASRGMVTAK